MSPKTAREIVTANLRPYIVINILYYGLILCGMLIAVVYPQLQQKMTENLQVQFADNSLLGLVARVYQSGNVPLAALLTFLVNSIAGAFAQITAPSAIIPFAGFAVGTIRPLIWGLTLAPTNHKLLIAMAPHSLTLLLEGQGYVLTIFGCYLWGSWLLNPAKAGYANRKQAYVAGLRTNMQLYSLILVVLSVAAVYEAIEVCALARFLGH